MDWDLWREREKMYACWLCNFPYLGNGQLHQLCEAFGGPEGVYHASQEEWEKVLSSKQATRLKEYTAAWLPEKEYRRMRTQGIELVTIQEKNYPERLRTIPDAPFGLFFRGSLPQEEAPAVAVIGARECSEYGRYVARQLGEMLGKCGVTVISGMARGIDGICQEAALEVGGYSVGVLGSGVDICYPAQNRGLYERLGKTGAVISSYPLNTPARSQNFPPRNRIVSGLADVVVAIEAKVKSGTLITVDLALEQGREVYAVPGRVTDRLSDGCNRLIRQGAGVLLEPEGFVEEMWELWERKSGREAGRMVQGKGREEGQKQVRSDGSPMEEMSQGQNRHGKIVEMLSPELSAVYEALDFTPHSPEELRGKLPEKYRDGQIITFLMNLCMKQLAVQVSPGRFCRTCG